MNDTTRQMLSVGIDIGTTTTQLVFSRLTLSDQAVPGQIPRVQIHDRQVIYRSPVAFTPLVDAQTIDAPALAAMIQVEYQRAGVIPAQVETGAAIITGETARKKNADQVLQAIAGLAGDFVVTAAGPHVESMIAGRGSGAAAYSKSHFGTVTNIDIGGGSTNSATFRQGELTSSAAMNIGGRLMEVDPSSGRITHITGAAAHILNHLGLSLRVGDTSAFADLARITACMAEMTVELIEGGRSALSDKLYLTAPAPLSARGKPLMFSGGVGYYYYENPLPRTVQDVTLHGDLGPLLAYSLRQNPALQAYQILQPAETLRATVLGASSQMVSLSGSTIWAEDGVLPLKNVPVVRPKLTGFDLTPEVIRLAISTALQYQDVHPAEDRFIINFELKTHLDYDGLTRIARGLASFSETLPDGKPLLVVVEKDYAQSLGQTVKGLLPRRPLIVIDQVGLKEGDFIDIGAPMLDGRVVPLIIKTLVFYQ